MTRSANSATACVFGCLLTLGALNAAAQEAKPESTLASQPNQKAAREALWAAIEAKREAKRDALEPEIDRLMDAYDLSPQPLPDIPDDPPPHEGAMIDMPAYRIEPPDLILVEVLEALPGRPISGERLVRPDGTIALGFYGVVHVRGLTVEQAKVKIIKHMRKYLTDDVLGLVETIFHTRTPAPAPAPPLPPIPRDLEGDAPLLPLPEKPKAPSNPKASLSVQPKARSASTARRGRPIVRQGSRNAASINLASSLQSPEPDEPGEVVEEPVKSIKVPLGTDPEISIHIEIKKGPQSASESTPTEDGKAEMFVVEDEDYRALPPDDSDRVFIDVTAYNSKFFYVLGDVAAPGKIPSTGNETVLDALQYAGGFVRTADSKNVRLVRPGRNGKPGKVYPIDLEAIEARGETATNYQLFPGDRILVGRDEVVKKTIQMDRTSAAIQDVMNSIYQEALTVRTVKQAAPDQPEVLIKNLVEFWIHELNRPEGAVFNEETLREILLRSLNIKPDAPKAEK